MASTVPWNASELGEESRSLSVRHIPALDGLRGLAILAVMCHHFLFNPWRGAGDGAGTETGSLRIIWRGSFFCPLRISHYRNPAGYKTHPTRHAELLYAPHLEDFPTLLRRSSCV